MDPNSGCWLFLAIFLKRPPLSSTTLKLVPMVVGCFMVHINYSWHAINSYTSGCCAPDTASTSPPAPKSWTILVASSIEAWFWTLHGRLLLWKCSFVLSLTKGRGASCRLPVRWKLQKFNGMHPATKWLFQNRHSFDNLQTCHTCSKSDDKKTRIFRVPVCLYLA